MRILATLINLVPYHVARWNAAARIPRTEIHVVQMRSQDDFHILEASGAETRFHLSTLGFRDMRVPSRTLLSAVEGAFDRSRPEVAVVNGYGFPISLATLQVACARRIPAVICSESNRDDFPRGRLTEAIKRRVVRLCAAGFVGAMPQAAYLCELGLPSTQVFLGYNAVDNEHFRSGADKARACASQLRAEKCLPQQFYMAVARFTGKKNLAGLIAAYGLFTQQAGRLAPALVILGDGPLRSDLERQVSGMGLSSKVLLRGSVPHDLLPVYYGLATGFIHASTTEQWGLVVNEAMASGLPVLVSNRCGCAPDLVKDGVNGFTFDPYDTQTLAQLMFKVSASDFPRSAFGKASQSIIANWGPERFAAGLKDAVDCAFSSEPKRASGIDRLMLRALLAR